MQINIIDKCHPDTSTSSVLKTRLPAEALREGWVSGSPHIFHNISGVHEFTITGSTTIYIFLHTTQQTELTVITRCTEPGAHVDVRIIHLQKSTEVLKLHTVQHHEKPHTTSIVTVKGVLYDQAQFTYQGKIYVGEQAEHTHAEQKSHTLLLSSTARAQATPSLEVLTKKVQCKHGSAIAACNAKQLEYLASRGIALEDVHKILVESFFLALLDDHDAQEYYRDYFLSRIVYPK
jgi:Fe-S cluster assembly scaffold protein SufB